MLNLNFYSTATANIVSCIILLKLISDIREPSIGLKPGKMLPLVYAHRASRILPKKIIPGLLYRILILIINALVTKF